MSMNPGDVEIRNCTLSGAGGSVDIAQRIHSFSIWESVKKPYIALEMSIIDNVDLLRNGYVDITTSGVDLSFGQPGQAPYTQTFAIMSAEKTRNLQNQRTAMYKLIAYSPHMTKFPKVQRAYKNQTATSIAQNLIQQYLGPNKGVVVGSPSMGVLGDEKMPYNINGVSIHKAIRSTLLKGVSSTGSAYLYFENQHEIVIDTLEHLIASRSGGETFFQRPLGKNFLLDVATQQNVMLSFKEESRMNRPAQLQSEGTQTRAYDMFSNAFKGGGGSGGNSYNNLSLDSLRPPSFLFNAMAGRRKAAAAADAQAMTIHVPLNTGLTVGRGFNVEVQSPSGDLDDDSVRLASVSGPLLAVEVRHTVNLDQSQKMSGTSTAKGISGEAAA